MTDPKSLRRQAVADALSRPVSSRMRAELELEWYYTEGQTLERSPTGGMLDALRMAATLEVECPVCCSRMRKLRAAAFFKRVHLIPPDRIWEAVFQPGTMANGEPCTACAGVGKIVTTLEAIKATNRRKEQLQDANEAPAYEVTARPTGHEVRDHGFDADDSRKLRCGHVSSCLRKIGPLHAEVIAAYYGPDATRCATVDPWGMHLAIMPLCEAGKALLKRARVSETASLHPIERTLAQARYQKSDPQEWRAELLDRGLVQVTAMLADAVEAFSEVL